MVSEAWIRAWSACTVETSSPSVANAGGMQSNAEVTRINPPRNILLWNDVLSTPGATRIVG